MRTELVGTISGNVVLICRRVLIRLRASVVLYEEAIDGDITNCIGCNTACEIICVCENEKYPDGSTCKVEQC